MDKVDTHDVRVYFAFHVPCTYAVRISKWLCLSVCCLSNQKWGYVVIYRVIKKQLLNPTVTLKST